MASDGDSDMTSSTEVKMEPLLPTEPGNSDKPAPFVSITENIYLKEKQSSKERKKAKKMVCECTFDPRTDDPSNACGSDCLNRLLMMECGSRCPCGQACSNRRFQKAEYANAEVFKTENKGWGLRALQDIPVDTFVMEYCGEVCSAEEFVRRKKEYHQDHRRHYYFMSLKSDEILDATRKGNLSRFINHSCDPNCETQKWTVNGLLRVGFFSVQPIKYGQELTFDYKFERFGEVAQKCFCGSANCRGFLGGSRPKDSKKVEPVIVKGTKMREEVFEEALDEMEQTIYDIVGHRMKLTHQKQVLPLSRAMIQAESSKHRIMFLKVLQGTSDAACLKRFLSYQGLPLIWSWMVDSTDLPLDKRIEIQLQLLRTLKCLPVTSRNQLEENRILSLVEKWSKEDVGSYRRQAVDTVLLKKEVSTDLTHTMKLEPVSSIRTDEEELVDSTLPTDNPVYPTHLTKHPIDDTHLKEDPVDHAHLTDYSVDLTHRTEDPVNHTHTKEDPVDHTHSKEDPVDHTHTKEDPVDHTHSKEDPVDHTHTKEDPVDHTHTKEDPVDHILPKEGQLDHTHSKEDPVDHTHSKEDPVDHTHSKEDPVDHTHTKEDPVDHTHTKEDPVDHTHPKEDPVDHTHTKEDPVDHTHSMEDPVEHTHSMEDLVDHTYQAEDTVGHTHLQDGPVDLIYSTQDPMDHTPLKVNSMEHTSPTDNSMDRTSQMDDSMEHVPLVRDPMEHTSLVENSVYHVSPREDSGSHTPSIEDPMDNSSLTEDTIDHTSPIEDPVHLLEDHSSLSEDPVDHTPLAEDPVDHTSLTEDPVDHTPLAEDPVDHTPLAEDPVDHTPLAEDPVDHTPLAEDPVDHTPLAEDPVDHTPLAEDPASGNHTAEVVSSQCMRSRAVTSHGPSPPPMGQSVLVEAPSSTAKVDVHSLAAGSDHYTGSSHHLGIDHGPGSRSASERGENVKKDTIENVMSFVDPRNSPASATNADSTASNSLMNENDVEEMLLLARELIDQWKKLKEVFRIPKKPKSSHSTTSQSSHIIQKNAEVSSGIQDKQEEENGSDSLWPSPFGQNRKRSNYSGKREWREKKHHFSPPRHAQTSPNIPPTLPPSLPPMQSSYHSQSSPVSHYHGNRNSSTLTTLPLQPFLHPIPSTSSHTPPTGCLVAMNTQSTTRPVFTTPVHHQGPFVLPQLRGTMSTQSSNLVQVPTLGKSLDADEKGPLPNNWKVAFDGSGNSYYYHVLTRKSQWERPTANDSEENPIEMVEMTMATPSPVTPTQDEMPNSGKLKVPRTPEESPPGTEEEDSTEKVTSTTSHTVAKDSFRHQLSKLVVHCLNKHRKPDCKSGRILNLSDFKHLARKLTHTIIDKEISRKGSYENLQFVDSVRHKTKEFVRAYMKKCGPVYKRV